MALVLPLREPLRQRLALQVQLVNLSLPALQLPRSPGSVLLEPSHSARVAVLNLATLGMLRREDSLELPAARLHCRQAHSLRGALGR